LIKFVLLNSIDYKVLFYFLFYIPQDSKIRTRKFQKVFIFISYFLYTDLVYLDHAGATLYSELQMESVFKDLTSNVYGNPRILYLHHS
jgi:hypothetical protein